MFDVKSLCGKTCVPTVKEGAVLNVLARARAPTLPTGVTGRQARIQETSVE